MNVFPKYSEVLVSSFSPEEVVGKIRSATYKVNSPEDWEADDTKHLFNGKVGTEKFRLSLNIKKADNFLPLISGKIEPINSGCIIFLNYSLFPASALFLAFWGIITFLAAIFLILYENNFFYALVSLSAGVGNLAFAHHVFKTKIKHSQLIFHRMLSLQEKD